MTPKIITTHMLHIRCINEWHKLDCQSRVWFPHVGPKDTLMMQHFKKLSNQWPGRMYIVLFTPQSSRVKIRYYNATIYKLTNELITYRVDTLNYRKRSNSTRFHPRLSLSWRTTRPLTSTANALSLVFSMMCNMQRIESHTPHTIANEVHSTFVNAESIDNVWLNYTQKAKALE